MIGFMLIFLVIGFLIGLFLSEGAITIWIIVITAGWALVMGPWAIATFLELVLGVAIANGVKKNNYKGN